MPALAINTQYVNLIPINHHNYSTIGFEGVFQISSTLEDIDIGENFDVIVASPTQKDLNFISGGVITKINQKRKVPPSVESITKNKQKGLPTPKDTYNHSFTLKITKELKANNLLSDLEYSIKSVYRFSKPIVHFQQQYRSLPKQDYDTIINGWIYIARTTFGKIVNAIPRQNKLEFMLQAMDHFSTVDFRDINLIDGLAFLYNYIDKRILSRGRLLVATKNLIEEHLSDIVPIDEIGFIDPETEKTNNLTIQANAFEKLFHLENKIDFHNYVKIKINEDKELEQRFLQIFKDETWPIDLAI